MHKKNRWLVGTLCALSVIFITSLYTSLYSMNIWQWMGYKTYTPEEQALINEIKKIEAHANPEEIEFSPKEISTFLKFIVDNKFEASYPKAFNELSARQLMSQGQEADLLNEQIEHFNTAALKGDLSFLPHISDEAKKDMIRSIQQLRDEIGNQYAYQELYAALHPQERKSGLYPTTEQAEIKTSGYTPIMAHIINLNAVELQSGTCEKVIDFKMPLEEVAELFGGNIPENLDELDLVKEKKITTICKELTKKQKGNECGLMSVYNAIQFYNLLTGKTNKAQFEQALMAFNNDAWQQDVQSCPIDLADIVTLIKKHAPQLSAMQYTIIPTLVDDNNRLSYRPSQRKMILVGVDGSISATFDQDTSLLHAIESIRNSQIDTYVHLFFLNNVQISGRGASMRHWIPVVLYKQHNQVYLYALNSQSVYYEDTANPAEKVVDIERLKKVVEKDNGWIRALIQLLSINPQALNRALVVANGVQSNDYNHDYAADILKTIDQDNSEIARDIRTMLSPR